MVSYRPTLLLVLLTCLSWACYAVPNPEGGASSDPWDHGSQSGSSVLPDCHRYDGSSRLKGTGLHDNVNGASLDQQKEEWVLTPRSSLLKQRGITKYVYVFHDASNAVIASFQVGPGPQDSCRVRDPEVASRTQHVAFYYVL